MLACRVICNHFSLMNFMLPTACLLTIHRNLIKLVSSECPQLGVSEKNSPELGQYVPYYLDQHRSLCRLQAQTPNSHGPATKQGPTRSLNIWSATGRRMCRNRSRDSVESVLRLSY